MADTKHETPERPKERVFARRRDQDDLSPDGPPERYAARLERLAAPILAAMVGAQCEYGRFAASRRDSLAVHLDAHDAAVMAVDFASALMRQIDEVAKEAWSRGRRGGRS